MTRDLVVGGLSLALAWDWTQTVTLIFGGCCSNALTLEQLTSHNPHAGSLITFSQFLFITLHGLPKFVQFTPYPRLKPRQLPVLPYLLQVVLFCLVSLLNNAAFAYKIPMPVHIVFRSGGLIVNMVMGWLLQRKRYHSRQIFSVFVVTAGVALTTLSVVTTRSSPSHARAQTSTSSSLPLPEPTDVYLYMTGIFILFVALLLSSLLGIAQDVTYAAHRKRVAEQKQPSENQVPPWQESMFYMHFLSLPMFLTMRQDLTSQFQDLLLSPSVHLAMPSLSGITIPQQFSSYASPVISYFPIPPSSMANMTIAIPSALLILFLNTLTQLVCVAGVHRLTSRVSSLTVTLVLIVRKAVSLLISVLLFSDRYERMDTWSKTMMMGGAGMVFMGTLAYAIAPTAGQVQVEKKQE